MYTKEICSEFCIHKRYRIFSIDIDSNKCYNRYRHIFNMFMYNYIVEG